MTRRLAYSLVLALCLVLQTGMAAACHMVGDVHVICHADGVKLVYTEEASATTEGTEPAPCCNGHILATPTDAPVLSLTLRHLPQEKTAHEAAPTPHRLPLPPQRGPPSVSFL